MCLRKRFLPAIPCPADKRKATIGVADGSRSHRLYRNNGRLLWTMSQALLVGSGPATPLPYFGQLQ
jgi:hypothetical protein